MKNNKILGNIEHVTFDWKWYTSRSANKSNSSGRDGNQLRYAKLQTSAKEYTLWGFPTLKGVSAHIADNEEVDIMDSFTDINDAFDKNNEEITFWAGKYDNKDYLSHATGFYACTIENKKTKTRNTLVFIREAEVELYPTDMGMSFTTLNFKRTQFNKLFTC